MIVPANNMKLTSSLAAEAQVCGTAIGAGGTLVTEQTEDRPCHVYSVTLKGTDKAYLGVTFRKVTTRWAEHKKHAKAGSKTYFHNALRKHGFDAFEWEWLGTFETTQQALGYAQRCG